MFSGWKPREMVFMLWGFLGLAATIAATIFLDASFPVFTWIWILVPMLVVAKTRDAGRVGFRKVAWRELILVSAVNLTVLFAILLAFEPWSHTYQKLIQVALSQPQPDTTFAWLLRFPRLSALGGMLAYSGFVTLFGEELFFRGWLLQMFQKRWGAVRAVLLQAVLFTVPNLLAASVLPTMQGVLYALVYAWLGIGVVGGWAALRTGSIWPSLISAALSNLVLVFLLT